MARYLGPRAKLSQRELREHLPISSPHEETQLDRLTKRITLLARYSLLSLPQSQKLKKPGIDTEEDNLVYAAYLLK